MDLVVVGEVKNDRLRSEPTGALVSVFKELMYGRIKMMMTALCPA